MFAFINRYHHTDTAMRYDANGNLILDIDRGISVIHYNLLKMFFSTGREKQPYTLQGQIIR